MKYTLQIKSTKRNEFIEITDKIQEILSKTEKKEGILTIFIPHTTAAITINENADDDVKYDLSLALNKIFYQMKEFKHLEGNSDAHLKASLFGFSLQIPYIDGKLLLGTWQGIYFCEFDGPRLRKAHIII